LGEAQKEAGDNGHFGLLFTIGGIVVTASLFSATRKLSTLGRTIADLSFASAVFIRRSPVAPGRFGASAGGSG
jgi:hypothetical protein